MKWLKLLFSDSTLHWRCEIGWHTWDRWGIFFTEPMDERFFRRFCKHCSAEQVVKQEPKDTN